MEVFNTNNLLLYLNPFRKDIIETLNYNYNFCQKLIVTNLFIIEKYPFSNYVTILYISKYILIT